MAAKITIACKYCGASMQRTERWPGEPMFRCCAACYEDDRPGQARFERMQANYGSRWAIDNFDPH